MKGNRVGLCEILTVVDNGMSHHWKVHAEEDMIWPVC